MLGTLWALSPYLIFAFWALATGAAVFALLPVKFGGSFREAVYLSACRGKLWDARPASALGPFTDCKVPQRWFAHFYDVGVAANTILLLLLTRSLRPSEVFASLPIGLLQVHLIRRCLETRLLLRYPADSHMHAIAYIFGLAYYVVLPFTCLPAWIFALPASAVLSKRSREQEEELQPSAEYQSFKLAGAAVFLAGSLLQHHSHRILARLSGRTAGDSAKPPLAVQHYKIPRGGGFEWVSCPHYLGEIIIYFGLALAIGAAHCLSWLPFLWVVANLSLAAGPTHEWYKRKFDSYPAGRRALIPFLY